MDLKELKNKIRVYTAEHYQLFLDKLKEEQVAYEPISIFDIGSFDKEKWKELINKKCAEKTDKVLVISYIEVSFNLVEQEHLLEEIIEIAQRPVYIFTYSPYIVVDEYIEFLWLI